ncbi:MAG: radical SAM family heme chaperone HemW [Bacteroidales bacterium]|nr:radical SAM family heme chaperone HemW [Bacteroidales bacterium]
MIYIHVPFCHRKCTYCAFHSRPSQGSNERYVNALVNEMALRKGEWRGPVRTLYFGGGTPSILSLNELGRIVEALHRHFDLSHLEEMTLEANPEDLDRDYLEGLRSLGFNRLSVGIQSLDDAMLHLLNRRHSAAQALQALETAQSVGFENISVDFIYGLPRQFQFSTFNFQLVTHISAYALTVEPGTALAMQMEQGRVALPGEEEVVRQYHALHEVFTREGFVQYEVSNYARPGYESRHNSRYWDRTPYLGLGPAAHSFALSDDGFTSVAHSGKRRWNLADNERYMASLASGTSQTSGTSKASPYFEEELLSERDACNELFMTSLRTVRGLQVAALPQRYREPLIRAMRPYVECGWVEVEGQLELLRFRPTAEGLLHADGMAAALFV